MSNDQLLEQAREMRKLLVSRKNNKKAVVIRTAQLFTQGNFTTVLLNGKYAGMSKKNPTDDSDSTVGVKLALRRAMTSLGL